MPLMVVRGKNDPRVNIRESNQIVAAVRDNGKPVGERRGDAEGGVGAGCEVGSLLG